MSIRFLRVVSAVALTAGLAACSSNSNSLSGTWSGSDNRADGTVFTSNVQLSESGSTVTGTVSTYSGSTLVYSGTVTGTFTSPTFSFTTTIPAGSVTSQPTCAFTLTGTATFSTGGNGTTSTAKTLVGTYAGIGTGACTNPTVNDTFTWTMQ